MCPIVKPRAALWCYLHYLFDPNEKGPVLSNERLIFPVINITGNSERESFATGPFWSIFDQLSYERSFGSLGSHARSQLGRRPVSTQLIMPKTKIAMFHVKHPLLTHPPLLENQTPRKFFTNFIKMDFYVPCCKNRGP